MLSRGWKSGGGALETELGAGTVKTSTRVVVSATSCGLRQCSPPRAYDGAEEMSVVLPTVVMLRRSHAWPAGTEASNVVHPG